MGCVLEGDAERKQQKPCWWSKGRNKEGSAAKDEERPSSDANVAIAIESDAFAKPSLPSPILLRRATMFSLTHHSLPTSPVPPVLSRRQNPPCSTPDTLSARPFKDGVAIDGRDQRVTSSPPRPLPPSAPLIQTNESSPPSRADTHRGASNWAEMECESSYMGLAYGRE
ncbi:uncharacterized protein ARMOST_18114 [Armillaria ostoyae]|uniref:Uncharacterized protein n=1 Tax=Armillaria ostoyae TaxID=47428 RepID=A0A284S0W2_ARMOS|nr:uncharacterized protein ARMOST_18114 [Armillaria ostoyae]